MGKGFKSGGSGVSAAYGLHIVSGNTRPANPKPDMLWLDTTHDITGYSLSATAPKAPSEGTVWISICDSGSIKVTSYTGKDAITICIMSARQYIGGKWVNVEAMIYQNGSWVRLASYVYIVSDGILQNQAITFYDSENALTQKEGYVEFIPGHDKVGIISTTDPVDLTDLTTFKFKVDQSCSYAVSGKCPIIAVGKNRPTSTNGLSSGIINVDKYVQLAVGTSTAGVEFSGEFILDVSDLYGEYYVAYIAGTTGQVAASTFTTKIIDFVVVSEAD